MVVNTRRKVVRYRGHTTHGGGSRKKRRGAGSRGGRGMAGTGKRAGQKKAGMKTWTLGSRGFVRLRTKAKVKIINVEDFTQVMVSRMVEQGRATKEGAVYSIDLTSLGYTKLLGTGSTSIKLKLRVPECTPRAAEKIKAAGGEVIGTETQ